MDDILAGEIELREKLKLSEGEKARTLTVSWLTGEKGFIGELTFVYKFHGGIYLDCHTAQYRITQHGYDGGNKANIYFNIQGGTPYRQLYENKSPDSMWQTGEWITYRRGQINMNVGANKSVHAYAKFTFDKSGGDPSAEAYITLD